MGRLTTRKGLREFVELALPSIVNAEPEAILVVIGEAPKDSLGTSIQTVESPLWQDSWHYLIINQLGGSGVDSASLF